MGLECLQEGSRRTLQRRGCHEEDVRKHVHVHGNVGHSGLLPGRKG